MCWERRGPDAYFIHYTGAKQLTQHLSSWSTMWEGSAQTRTPWAVNIMSDICILAVSAHRQRGRCCSWGWGKSQLPAFYYQGHIPERTLFIQHFSPVLIIWQSWLTHGDVQNSQMITAVVGTVLLSEKDLPKLDLQEDFPQEKTVCLVQDSYC